MVSTLRKSVSPSSPPLEGARLVPDDPPPTPPPTPPHRTPYTFAGFVAAPLPLPHDVSGVTAAPLSTNEQVSKTKSPEEGRKDAVISGGEDQNHATLQTKILKDGEERKMEKDKVVQDKNGCTRDKGEKLDYASGDVRNVGNENEQGEKENVKIGAHGPTHLNGSMRAGSEETCDEPVDAETSVLNIEKEERGEDVINGTTEETSSRVNGDARDGDGESAEERMEVEISGSHDDLPRVNGSVGDKSDAKEQGVVKQVNSVWDGDDSDAPEEESATAAYEAAKAQLVVERQARHAVKRKRHARRQAAVEERKRREGDMMDVGEGKHALKNTNTASRGRVAEGKREGVSSEVEDIPLLLPEEVLRAAEGAVGDKHRAEMELRKAELLKKQRGKVLKKSGVKEVGGVQIEIAGRVRKKTAGTGLGKRPSAASFLQKCMKKSGVRVSAVTAARIASRGKVRSKR